MRKRLYSPVVPLISVACSQKVELGSTGVYPSYQIGEMVSLIPVDSPTYGDVITHYSYISGFQERTFKRIAGFPGNTIHFQNQQCIVNGKKCEWEFIRKPFYGDDECEEYCERLPNGIKVNTCKSVAPIGSTTTTMSAIVVLMGSYFVAGNYRSGSVDSRSRGCIAVDSIIGKSTKENEYLRVSPVYHTTKQ